MTTDLKDRCRRLAELNPGWPQPGMACRDPVTGALWRLTGTSWIRESDQLILRRDDHITESEPVWDGNRKGLRRTIAAGPDPDDAATLGALLLGLGDFDSFCGEVDGMRDYSVVLPPFEELNTYSTRAEAILRACIAQAKEGK